ncbi:MAG: (Fe-S)-binding protein [Bacteroidetes bacterium]|nr:(Fe-S)-binding protein [Bacteroidota bacterium]MDA0903251.1 (Fe-S)-binding protein [Bacteroidota bacterium]MDA1242190.1 (Fe-S)-binding protein [Bacteroidota bacterium]
MSSFQVPTLAEMTAQGQTPEVLFWVGCAGSFDDRAKRITKAIARILHHCEVSFAVLGSEESCTGDPAKRAGNEFLFQMQAAQNIAVLNGYEVKRIVTGCPHCFNVLKNEYPELGGSYEVMHHTQFIRDLIDQGRLKVADGNPFKGRRITFHDPCYLGRGNGEYAAPRDVLTTLDAELVEMRRCKQNGLCCGAGGAQMFKEAEKGHREVNHERTDDVLDVNPHIVATGCPFCNTMMTDGVKHAERESSITVKDIAELIAEAADLLPSS